MSSTTRDYVGPGKPMYRVAAYDSEGVCIAAKGPYATIGAARGQRKGWLTQYRVEVEVCYPKWIECDEY